MRYIGGLQGVFIILAGIVLAFGIIQGHVHAQQPAYQDPVTGQARSTPVQPVKFALSETENVKLDNLRLEAEIIRLRKSGCETTDELGGLIHSQNVNRYVTETLKAHNNPVGVVFDSQSLSWQTVEAPKPQQ